MHQFNGVIVKTILSALMVYTNSKTISVRFYERAASSAFVSNNRRIISVRNNRFLVDNVSDNFSSRHLSTFTSRKRISSAARFKTSCRGRLLNWTSGCILRAVFGRANSSRSTTTLMNSLHLDDANASMNDASESGMTDMKYRKTPDESLMHKDAMEIIKHAIDAVDPYKAVSSSLSLEQVKGKDISSSKAVLRVNTARKSTASTSTKEVCEEHDDDVLEYDLDSYEEIILIAFGKASLPMAKAAQDSLLTMKEVMNMTTKGIVIVKDDHATDQEKADLKKCNISVREASHPVPDERSVAAAREILDIVGQASHKSLIICMISGGGSALFCAPRSMDGNEFLQLQDLAETNECLLASGMPIEHMNIIRKRLEDGKGGRLAALAYPATMCTLVLSDIIGDPLDLIASGPTVPDPSSWEDAAELIEKYAIGRKDGPQNVDQMLSHSSLPTAVLNLIDRGIAGEIDDTPKSCDPMFALKKFEHKRHMQSETKLVGNNEMAVYSAAQEAAQQGYNTRILGSSFVGEASQISGVYTALASQLHRQKETVSNQQYNLAPLPAALICGGETTVTLPKHGIGKGGRNQEIGLCAALKLKELGLRDIVIASVGTDGTDGPTDAAGAIVDGGTIDRVEFVNKKTYLGDVALKNHDAYSFFANDDALLKTGPTGTNVADIAIILVK